MSIKTCSTCNVPKDISMFVKNTSKCKLCYNAMYKKKYELNAAAESQKRSIKQKDDRKVLKEKLIEVDEVKKENDKLKEELEKMKNVEAYANIITIIDKCDKLAEKYEKINEIEQLKKENLELKKQLKMGNKIINNGLKNSVDV